MNPLIAFHLRVSELLFIEMQITKSHILHNYNLKIICTDQIISLLKYLPVESSLTYGTDKLFQFLPIMQSLLTSDSKEKWTDFKGTSFVVLLHMFTHNTKCGATENQQFALSMFSKLNTELFLPCRVYRASYSWEFPYCFNVQ